MVSRPAGRPKRGGKGTVRSWDALQHYTMEIQQGLYVVEAVSGNACVIEESPPVCMYVCMYVVCMYDNDIGTN